ncbi:MAG: hypothetical protein MR966_13490 [Lachnospiraceae bacterium]|nr:hypothetical protein [Lachnospiraceae bacterium]
MPLFIAEDYFPYCEEVSCEAIWAVQHAMDRDDPAVIGYRALETEIYLMENRR